MPVYLRLYEDVLAGDAGTISLPALPRMIYVVHGSATIGGQTLADDATWAGEEAVTLAPGQHGVTAWRFEVAADAAAAGAIGGVSRLKLSAVLETLPQGDLLLRGDSVAFPPGGCAYLHRHQGPGIRCLLDGGIRIDTHGHSTSYGPGGAWYESGPDAVFAQAAMDRSSRFVRVMLLPCALLGKSSIQYLNEDDKLKPKPQSYKIFTDIPLAFRP